MFEKNRGPRKLTEMTRMREERITNKETQTRITSGLSTATEETRNQGGKAFHILRENYFNPKILYSTKLYLL